MQPKEIVCIRCGRKLKTTNSINNGMGAICFKKFMDEPMEGQIDIEEVIKLEPSKLKPNY